MPLPDDRSLDSTLALLREGYAFIPNRCRRLGTDAFRTRLMLAPAVCAQGEDAALELLNLLRPTAAAARYVVFAAMHLHREPERRAEVLEDAAARGRFVEEVRRLAPFIPFMAGKALEPFAWRGHRFRRGDRVVFDLYGTNRDPRLWRDPERFDPDRFRGRAPGLFDFVPQGGGEHMSGHRCPGEAVVLAALDRSLPLLAGAMRWAAAPGQDLTVDLSRIPALPRSGFVVEGVRAIPAAS